MTLPSRIAALIVAAGRGSRMGGATPKQFQQLAGQTVLQRSYGAFARHPDVAAIWVVVHPDDMALAAHNLPDGAELVPGGATRGESVAAGLAALDQSISHVLIHDAARATIPAEVIDRVIAALATGPAAAPGLPLADALWRGTHSGTNGTTVAEAVPRDGLWRAQTPQGFEVSAIRAAHAASDGTAADDVEVARAAGFPVHIVPGHEDNFKLTYPQDRTRAVQVIETQERRAMDIRLGNGYDVHRFCEGDHVMLCGVRVPHGRGLRGHSDADVGMHAVTDAIYGALALGDIGQHFPPSDPQWKGAASDLFLRHAGAAAAERGYAIGNIDCTLVCERPKIGPHAPEMRARLADILGLDPGRVSVKATTSERLGFTGREEGIAAIATATLISGGAPAASAAPVATDTGGAA